MSKFSEQFVPVPEGSADPIANEIRKIRRLLDLSQPEFGPLIGISAKSYPSYEGGRRKPDAEHLARARILYKERTGEEWGATQGTIQTQDGDDAGGWPDVTIMLPEHVQEAYKIVREALDVAKADISTMDQDQVGLVIGLAAEAIAKGNRVEARQTLLRRAEVLLGLKPQ